jgi:hypothetical protein
MGYDYPPWYKVKKDKEYPWPCKSEPNRTIKIFTDDVLTKQSNGKYQKHTGLGCLNIHIPDEDVIKQDTSANLRLL